MQAYLILLALFYCSDVAYSMQPRRAGRGNTLTRMFLRYYESHKSFFFYVCGVADTLYCRIMMRAVQCAYFAPDVRNQFNKARSTACGTHAVRWEILDIGALPDESLCAALLSLNSLVLHIKRERYVGEYFAHY